MSRRTVCHLLLALLLVDIPYNTPDNAPPGTNFKDGLLDIGDSVNAERRVYGNISTRSFQRHSFRCVRPLRHVLEKIGSEIRPRRCAILCVIRYQCRYYLLLMSRSLAPYLSSLLSTFSSFEPSCAMHPTILLYLYYYHCRTPPQYYSSCPPFMALLSTVQKSHDSEQNQSGRSFSWILRWLGSLEGRAIRI